MKLLPWLALTTSLALSFNLVACSESTKPTTTPTAVVKTESANKTQEQLKQDAEHGYLEAQLALGNFYAGKNDNGANNAIGMKWFEKAAEQNNAEAQYKLGFLYMDGYEVQTDKALALKWLMKSGENGYPDAQMALAQIYSMGLLDIQPDEQVALKWFKLAAASGNAEAKALLEKMK